jgi:hypothetical protein
MSTGRDPNGAGHSRSRTRRTPEGSARFIVCAFTGCGRGFFLCSRCDRGNRYCSQQCAAAARRAYLVTVRRKYASSQEAREDHRTWMERYRAKQRAQRVVDLGRQNPATGRRLPSRSSPADNPTAADGRAKAGHLRAPPSSTPDPPRPWRPPTGGTPLGVRCSACGRVFTVVRFEPPRARR